MPLDKPNLEELLGRDSTNYCTDSTGGICLKIVAVADLPTRFGDFQIVAFYNDLDEKEHVAVVKGEAPGSEGVPVRLHSECLTGDALGSLRCDCRDQLTSALEAIGGMDEGVLLYLRQEGRGIGLLNKIKAYQLQDNGYDTVEANIALGFQDDERDYAVAAHMLLSMGIKSIRLMTNNPKKMDGLRRHGVDVEDRIPHIMQPEEHNTKYLQTKMKKSGHLLEPVFDIHHP